MVIARFFFGLPRFLVVVIGVVIGVGIGVGEDGMLGVGKSGSLATTVVPVSDDNIKWL